MPVSQEIAQLKAQVAELKQKEKEATLQIASFTEIVAEKDRQIAELKEHIQELQKELKASKRAGKRQAHPFARKKKKKTPKRSGRKKGIGPFSHRQPPHEIDREAEVPLVCCPHCGGEMGELTPHMHFEEEIPQVKPIVTKYITYSGHCKSCGEHSSSRHQEQISTATGAAGVVIGPRAKALAAELKHRFGMSYGKICDFFKETFSLECSRGGLFQGDLKLAQKARPVYEELVETLRASSVVYCDETGWRIGTLSAWLWVFTNQNTTVYTIEQGKGSRRHQVVVSILGKDFEGIFVSDRFLAYDHQALDKWLKQKCVGHLLRNMSDLKAIKSKGAIRFAKEVSSLLKEALRLKNQQGTLTEENYCLRKDALNRRLDKLLHEKRKFSDEDNKKFATRLRDQRPHLLRFLDHDEVEGTNNQAERQLRPAVITRKTTGCNRSDEGAQAHSILASILATCKQRAISVMEFLRKLQFPSRQPPSLPEPTPD